jgi:hypothetical protein
MSETCAAMQARLDSYVAARDKLVTGAGAVRIRDGENELTYRPGDTKRLDQLIREVKLQMQRARCPGCGRRGAMIYLTPSG